jgi:hypothetical protein
MGVKQSDTILAPGRVSTAMLDGIVARLDHPDAHDKEALTALRAYSRTTGIDDGIAIAQALHETGNFTSVRWRNDLNIAGIGIPSDSTVQPFRIASVDEAVRIFVNCLYAAVTGKRSPAVPVPANAEDWFVRVWLAKVNHPNFPGVRTVADLNTRYAANNDQHATWAWDDGYGGKLVSRAKQFMPGLPDQGSVTTPPKGEAPMAITFGLVPHPAYQNRPITKAEGRGQNNLGKRSVKGVVWHRILGSLYGTDGYFRNESVNALTDYGVGVAARDGAANDGMILRWNDPLGWQSGWASGTYNGAYGDGEAFVRKYGVNAINRDQASIEISGDYDTPLSEKARDAIAALTAYWADQYRIPWDVFPIAPQDGFSFVRWHQEFTLGTGKVCPGAVVIRETPALIERTRAILKKHQTAGTSPQPVPDPEPEPTPEPQPEPAELKLPAGMSWGLVGRLYNPLGIKDPDTGKRVRFSQNSRTAMKWFDQAVATIPEGGSWKEGNWGPLVEIIRRGDGGRVYQFVGFTHPVGPAKEQDAA